MRFALFVSVVPDEHDSPVKVRPEKVFAITQDPERVDVCELHVPGGVFVVRGTVEEVFAALESATAPPVAAAVEVAPTDLERASGVLDLLAMACEHYSDAWDDLDINTIDRAIGVNSPELHDTRDALRVLAAKLRGGG